jgi:hypothetical protein
MHSARASEPRATFVNVCSGRSGALQLTARDESPDDVIGARVVPIGVLDAEGIPDLLIPPHGVVSGAPLFGLRP